MANRMFRYLVSFCFLHHIIYINAGDPVNLEAAIIDTDDVQQANDEICMGELGCFRITKDFISLRYRPINVLPHTREKINTRHFLYTKRNPKEPQLIEPNKKSITESNYNPNNPTKFIVHGFMDSEIFGPWMKKLKDEFLLHGDYNFFIVDWSGGNRFPYYQATANTRVVGAEIALMVNALQTHVGKKPEDIHIMGHSLGSHIAGYAGKRLKNLGRITGIDPAEPYFQNMPPIVRLDFSDANFVDAIHTDAKSIFLLGLGMNQSVGHVDFFPNSGRDQPGCKKDKFTKFITDGLSEGFRRFYSCNHQRAVDFLHNSINYRKVVPVGYQCADYETFLTGKCADCGPDKSKCAIMGIRADEYQKKIEGIQDPFYLKTGSSEPFWLYHYQVSVKLFKPKGKVDDPKGSFEINLHGSNEDFLAKHQPSNSLLTHGNLYQFLVTTDKEIGDLKSVTFKWISSSLNPLKLLKKPKLYVQYVQVVPMNVIEESPRKMTGRTFCAKPDREIVPKTVTTLLKNDKCDLKD